MADFPNVRSKSPSYPPYESHEHCSRASPNGRSKPLGAATGWRCAVALPCACRRILAPWVLCAGGSRVSLSWCLAAGCRYSSCCVASQRAKTSGGGARSAVPTTAGPAVMVGRELSALAAAGQPAPSSNWPPCRPERCAQPSSRQERDGRSEPSGEQQAVGQERHLWHWRPVSFRESLEAGRLVQVLRH